MSKATTALILGDLQNDFLHPEGAYGRARQSRADDRGAAREARAAGASSRAQNGILTVATLFTLVPGRGGEPIISPHLKSLRPFLKNGDFAPGSWGQQLIDALAPADVNVEKIAYSAFHMPRASNGCCANAASSISISPASSPMAASPRRCATRMCASSIAR